jgi:cellulose synthase (UDP-forming)
MPARHDTISVEPTRRRAYANVTRTLVVLSAITGVVYLKWLLFDAVPDNRVLFAMLLTAELFNIVQAAGFWYTIWKQRWTEPPAADFSASTESVDIFVTVCGEPIDVVERTVAAAMRIRHPRKLVWILDDGRSPDVAALAAILGAGYLVRPERRGAKAGNINDAMVRTRGDYIVIFDADHIPHADFLERTMAAFDEPHTGFVQTPQAYRNRFTNRVAAGAHEQQALFYGTILRGKDARAAVFSCGTNVIFKRSALEAIGGMPEDSITEDLRVSFLLMRAGFRSSYVPVILAEGLGPVDVGGYFSQQLRWARGGLEILFRRRPFYRKMAGGARIQFGLSFLYWFTGIAYSIYLILPSAFLIWGVRPVQAPNQYPVYFLPYVTITIITMAYASDFRLTFRALWFTLATFPMHVLALLSALTGGRAKFVVTSKGAASRSLAPVMIHVLTIVALAASAIYGIAVRGVTPAVINNVAFVLGHILLLQGFVRYALAPEMPDDASLAENDGEDAFGEPLDCSPSAGLPQPAGGDS